jgi:predicted aldo/keto reductase-like oxidoreductase
MKYRRFGRTELAMPVFSCGVMRCQYKWQEVEPKEVPLDNQENLEACICRAFELGINHIETARGYGTSEMQLGRILPTLPRDQIIVQTKVGAKPSAPEFLQAFDTSMKHLRLDHVDLLALHGMNNRELLHRALRKDGCVAAARKLQKDGRVRFLGFSTHATTDIILEAINSGEFDYVNLHWYFVNDLNWPAIEAARARDMGVFIISPNDKGGKLYEPPPKLVNLCAPLTPMQFNDLYCLARPEVHTLSCGVVRPADFEEHVRALDYYDRIPETLGPIGNKSEIDVVCRGTLDGRPVAVLCEVKTNITETEVREFLATADRVRAAAGVDDVRILFFGYRSGEAAQKLIAENSCWLAFPRGLIVS